MNPKASITTKTGDRGQASIFSGERVSKNSDRLEAVGTVDELVSILGIARCHCRDPLTEEAVLYLQRALFTFASELATSAEKLETLPKRIDQAAMGDLDRRRDELEEKTELPKGFIVPGGSLGSAHMDHARTVARRIERRVVAMNEEGVLANPIVLSWINRLSDYLYLLARTEEDEPLLVKF